MFQEWAEVEERDFAKLMAAGHMERLEAIRLYRRNKSNIARALAIALREAPTETMLAKRAALSIAARKRWVRRRERLDRRQASKSSLRPLSMPRNGIFVCPMRLLGLVR